VRYFAGLDVSLEETSICIVDEAMSSILGIAADSTSS
jgi:hypothetical protein